MFSTYRLKLHVPDWFTSPTHSATRAGIVSFIRYLNLILTVISTILYGRVGFDRTFNSYLAPWNDSAAAISVITAFFINLIVIAYTITTLYRASTPNNKLTKALLHFLAGVLLVTCAMVTIFKGRLFRSCSWGYKDVCKLFSFYNTLLYGAIFTSSYVAIQWWIATIIYLFEALAEKEDSEEERVGLLGNERESSAL